MTRRLLLSYVSITLFVLVILEIPLGLTAARSAERRLVADLERDARVLATFAEDALESGEVTDLARVASDYHDRTDGRVVITDVDGVSVADSEDLDGPRRDFSTRPEFSAALEGTEATGSRYSQTLDERLMYVAVPVASGGDVLGAVRVTYPRSDLDERIRRIWIGLLALAVVILSAVVVVGALLARSVTRPVRALRSAARRVADGDLGARAPTDVGPPEIRELAAQFNDMTVRLAELLDAQRAFVADASHELRSPLTALRLRLENLEATAEPSVALEVSAATDEIRRLTRLVDTLLALARSEGSTARPETVDLSEVAAARVEGWTPLADEQGVRLEAEIAPGVTARAVPGAVEQILDNYLANAMEVAPEASSVVVEVGREGSTAFVHVVDEGPGLTPEERRRAFDRFWRHPGAGGGGSGLGLAVVSRLARDSGGRCRLDPGPAGGIEAVLELVAVAGEAEP